MKQKLTTTLIPYVRVLEYRCLVHNHQRPSSARAILQVPIYYKESDIPIFHPIDATYFRRILENLLANAALHNPDGTLLNVSLEEDVGTNAMVIRIQDNGVGMDDSTIELLFERYYRGTNTDALMQGSGLGMAISKQLVIQHGGKIEVQSKPGAGTTISLFFGGKD